MTPSVSPKKFDVISGNPTDAELAAIQVMVENHKREELVPVIRRSVFAQPQLRTPLPHQLAFGLRR